ncbi:hypothetical protein QFC19_003654 [Naganishia cerealis]|uniref:Uncharacterized protein n=1 Tax=Naganishia cerealis TaxID=610337 RepID=A0ACC2W019_9TREE|nr:hypothetical protein QFC19_003654 [Naganishia cerealis]
MAQTLVTIPHVKALHLPLPTSDPVLLAEGDLRLSLLPAAPPNHPHETLTLSIGHATFPITNKTPVVKTDTILQHASYLFAPALPEPHAGDDLGANGGELGVPSLGKFGKVKVVMKESTSPAEYEQAESLAHQLEETLKQHKCWKEVGYYDTEEELARVDPAAASYGTTIADTLSYYGRVVANRISSLTADASASPHTDSPAAAAAHPPDTVKSAATTTARVSTTLADYTHSATETISHAVHDGAGYLGGLASAAVAQVEHAVGAGGTNKNDGKLEGQGTGSSAPMQEIDQTARNFGQAGLETWDEVKLSAAGAAEG